MSASELNEWQAYFSIYPFTVDRQEISAAVIATTVMNQIEKLLASWAGKKKYEPISFEKFIPDYLGLRKPVVKDPLQRDVYAALKARVAELKGTDVEPGNPNPSS